MWRTYMFSLCLVLSRWTCLATTLKILLTNDDGIETDGLLTLKRALRNAGHEVIVYAPSEQQSGSGAGLTAAGVPVTEVDTDEYSVAATPATAVLIGLADLGGSPPDLVISGTNNGNNGGPQVIHSGTVGAARTGMSQGIVAFAVATNPPEGGDTLQHFTDVAHFMVKLVDKLKFAILHKVFPKQVGLKIGYPTVPSSDEVRGVKLAKNGDSSSIEIGFQVVQEPASGGIRVFAPNFQPSSETLDPDSDEFIVGQGFVSVLAIQSDVDLPFFDKNEIFLKQLANLVEHVDFP